MIFHFIEEIILFVGLWTCSLRCTVLQVTNHFIYQLFCLKWRNILYC